LKDLAGRAGLPVERLAMAWAFQNPGVDTVLVGARSTTHLDNAFQALETDLRREWIAEMATL
jgi:aryl-alcohol dehydrogenase-like predicted oxidoreductase